MARMMAEMGGMGLGPNSDSQNPFEMLQAQQMAQFEQMMNMQNQQNKQPPK